MVERAKAQDHVELTEIELGKSQHVAVDPRCGLQLQGTADELRLPNARRSNLETYNRTALLRQVEGH